MFYKIVRKAALFALLISIPGFASEIHEAHEAGSGEERGGHIHGSHPECPLPRSAQDVLRCAQENHPSVRRAKLSAEASQTRMGAAAQLPNPQFEAQSVYGNHQSETELSLLQPIQIGGKRSAKKDEAEAQQKQASADLRSVQADVTVETVTRLQRLRQIGVEKEILDEAIGTYAKLVAQYRGRPRLTPEQQVSLSVFKMALSDSRIKHSVLLDEEREIAHYFHLSTGHGLAEIGKVLPSAPKTWPSLDRRTEDSSPSPSLYRLMTDESLAQAELSVARADSWPDLRIGPMVMLVSEGPVQARLYGVRLSFDLPILSQNGGSRAHAAKNVWKAEKSIALLRTEESHERAEQLEIYREAVASLKEVPSSAELERDHQAIESLTLRGLISSSLSIEAHRQRTELEKSRNERELKAIQAQWKIYQLDGRVFEESL